ncbi:MAG: helix-turn-helix domain-containing protein [Elusimicrobia bacterium]|nr:helix-turn-helix domain-containing protein [Elusimicrobiota bacterium]
MEENNKVAPLEKQEKKKRKKTERIAYPSGAPEVMDIKELSSYLGIGKSKIYALIRAKKIPASRIGRQYRFYKALTDKWLQEKIIMPGEADLPLFERKAGAPKNT